MLDDLSSWLREQRLAHGWSVAEMGRQLHRGAKATGDRTVPRTAILASYVRRWEAGKIGLTERYRLHYCTALGIPPADFGPGPPTHDAPGEPSADATLSGSLLAIPGARASAGLPCLHGEPSGYRESGTEHNAAEQHPHADLPLGHLMAVLAEESLDFGEWADTSNIGDATLERYAAQVRQFARDYEYALPHPLLLDAKRLRDRVFAKLQGHQRPGQTRDLYLIAAQVCGMLAWISGDLGYQSAAQDQAWTAWVCAEHANHDNARAWVRVIQSKLAYWDDRFIESVQLAEDGLRYPSTDSGHALLGLHQARALARLGRSAEAAGTLAQAATALEHAGPDEVGGLYGLGQAKFHHWAGSIQIGREDAPQVLAEARQALMLFEAMSARERSYRSEMGTRMDEGHAHLLLGDLDGADAALRPVLGLAADRRGEPQIRHLRQVRQALTRPEFRNAALAGQLQEEIETYCRESIVNGLRG
jgi:transcriptional regulator with XRE-family HTH domain/tetratricopeptide (TPR) repeat protein